MRNRGRSVLRLCAAVACMFVLCGCSRGRTAPKQTTIRIGVSLYRSDDTFINNLRSGLESCAKEYEQASGTKVILDIQAAKGNQSTQNDQVERFLSLGCDVLCINPVDRMAVSSVIDQAMNAGAPVIFFNRQPAEEDMNRWDQLYYVGVDAKESAALQGSIVAKCYQERPEILDRNGDGKVSYVLLEGESSHQDSLIRTEWSVQTLKDAGVPIEKVTGGIANWERSQASALMEQWLKQYPGDIELVIGNNDDMALGAIDAIEREQARGIQVVGIDGTEPGMDAVGSGKMLGTVSSDKKGYAEVIFELALDKALGREVGLELEEGKYYWCGQEVVVAREMDENPGEMRETEEPGELEERGELENFGEQEESSNSNAVGELEKQE